MAALLTFLTASAPHASAGPWQREAGAVFLSFGTNVAVTDGATNPVSQDPALFVEWGASDAVTLAFSAHTSDAGRDLTATFTAQMALPVPENLGVASAGIGFGLQRDKDDQVPGAPPVGPAREDTLVTASLAWGRNLENGWVSADFRALHNAGSGQNTQKLDLTYGRHLSDRLSAIVQLQAGQSPETGEYAKLSSTVVYGLTDSLRLNAGVQQGLTGDQGTGLHLGLWLDF